jgi:transcriptional regulator with XRE-family HTH domain
MARIGRSLTLVSISSKIGIDAGQLSRFERGQFIRASENLQKYAKYLQIDVDEDEYAALAARVMVIASKSAKHREAVEEIVSALERFG